MRINTAGQHVFVRWLKRVAIGGADECWLWLGNMGVNGYGNFYLTSQDQRHYAHRFTYEYFVGPIPDGLHIDHLCRNKACVNPAHLEPVTMRENLKRGRRHRYAYLTHCKRGHPFDLFNTITNERGNRNCRECVNAWHRALRKRKREQQCVSPS